MAFCIVYGCIEGFDETNDGIARICPKCHNASVVGGKKKTYPEICFLPLPCLPIYRKQIWLCRICQWFVFADKGEPKRVGTPIQDFGQGSTPPGGRNPPQPGYGPNPGMTRPAEGGIT